MKKILRSVLLVVLALSMLLSLCACGKTEEAKAKNETAPEYMYKSEFVPVTGDDTVSYITARVYTDDGFYATGEEIVGSHKPADVEPQYFGQFDETEPMIYFVTYDGKVTRLDNFKPVKAPDAPKNADGEFYNFNSSSYVNSINFYDGKLICSESRYVNWTDTDEYTYDDDEYWDQYHYENEEFVRVLDGTGKELSCHSFELSPNEWVYSNGITDDAGNLVYTKTGDNGEYSLLGINPATGEKAYEIKTDDYVSSTVKADDGKIFVTFWSDMDMVMKQVNFETGTFGEGMTLPGDAYSVFPGGGDYKLYYNSGVDLYGVNPGSEEGAQKVISWMDCDVNPDEMYNPHVTADGTIYGLMNNYDSYTMSYDRYLVKITKVPYEASSKAELTLATQYLGWELRNTVINYNRKSETSRINVIDYSQYNTDNDYSAGLTKLTTEIMAGNCPDIIDLSGMSVSQLAAKNLLEDLYPYMDKDSEINRADYFENVLKAAENNGKLLQTVPYFSIRTVAGAEAIVGSEPGWNYNELQEALSRMPEGCSAFDVTTTRDDILSMCLGLSMADFVDWSTGEVNFDNDEFKALLTFASQFPDEYDWNTYDYQTDSTDVRISEGRQMLYLTSIDTLDSAMYMEACFGGKPVTFKGYPTYSGTGNTIYLGSGLAMAASCGNKDEAWDFLRTFFTEEYYVNNVSYMGLPVSKALFEKQLKKATTMTYQLDNYGNYVLDANGEKIPEQHYYAINDGMYTYYCLSQGMADKIMDLINTTTKVSVSDSAIEDIVKKQAAAFFEGQKSVDEVARLVQSNAKIYVNEQR